MYISHVVFSAKFWCPFVARNAMPQWPFLGRHGAHGAFQPVWLGLYRGKLYISSRTISPASVANCTFRTRLLFLKCWKLYKIITLTSTSSARNWLNIMRIKLSPIRVWRIQLWEPNLCKPTQVKTSNRRQQGCETLSIVVVWRRAFQGAFRTSGR